MSSISDSPLQLTNMSTPPFDAVYTLFEAAVLEEAYTQITARGLWQWLKLSGRTFMQHPTLRDDMEYEIGDQSYEWMMCIMDDIARRGWEEHRNYVRRIRSLQQLQKWAADQRSAHCTCREIRTGWVTICNH